MYNFDERFQMLTIYIIYNILLLYYSQMGHIHMLSSKVGLLMNLSQLKAIVPLLHI